MDFTLSPEQAELQRTVRDFLADKSPEAVVRRLMDDERGFEPATWQQMATQLGLQGLAIAETYGGAGFGLQEQAIVFEELGRALFCGPYFATVALAAPALVLAGGEAAADHLPGIASGDTLATVALDEVHAQRTGHGWALTGQANYVVDGHVADLILLPARTTAGCSLFAISGHAPGLKREPLATVDQTRKQARLTLDAVAGQPVGAGGAAEEILARVLDIAAVLLAAEQVGGAAACLAETVEYAGVREQFGRPIGSFQAIKHTWSEMLLEVESARAAAQYAAWAADAAPEELPAAAALAKAHCSEAYARVATESIQLHGGIGFTWEHRTHLYYKRAKSSELLFGTPAAHREQLVTRLGLTTS
jgi:alkylation response protein AidB-like acyl-CoA dehydrogenase